VMLIVVFSIVVVVIFLFAFMSGIVAVRLGNGERGLAWVKSTISWCRRPRHVRSFNACILLIFIEGSFSGAGVGARCDSNIDLVRHRFSGAS